MKNLNRTFLYLLTLALLIACEDEEKNPFPLDILEQGAVLRTISQSNPTIVNKSNPAGSDIAIEVEADDFQNGTRFESMNIYLSFVDSFVDTEMETETDQDDEDISTVEELFMSVPAGSFSEGPDGKPRYNITVNGQEAIDLLNLNSSVEQIDGGDIFRVRLEMILNDGSVFTSTNVNTNVTGQFFAAPFRYDASVVCILATPPTGEWMIAGQDSFGDGWNGASITVNIDGAVAAEFLVSGEQGTANSMTFNVPDDAQSLSLVYNPGDFDSENSFQITAPSGNVVADVAPSPTAGEINLNLCNE